MNAIWLVNSFIKAGGRAGYIWSACACITYIIGLSIANHYLALMFIDEMLCMECGARALLTYSQEVRNTLHHLRTYEREYVLNCELNSAMTIQFQLSRYG